MGKSKTRILRKGINNQITSMSRQQAVDEAAVFLNSASMNEAVDIITMFGLSAEELLEAGASYEAVTAIKNIFIE
jgi:hypothetical protein